MSALPEAHFGSASEVRVDWRDAPDSDPDDELIVPTPRDVVMMLGFDPAKYDAEETDRAKA